MLLVSLALALPFDDLLAEAAARSPALAAESARVEAARSELAAARLPMDPRAVLGADSLGAMQGDPDPTMFMLGVEQMMAGPGELGARVRAQEATVSVATVTRDLTLADLRLALASLVARVAWRQADDAAAAEQIAGLRRLREATLSRHARGTHPASALPSVTAPATPESLGAPPAPRRAEPRGAMPGMSGMGGGASSSAPEAPMATMAEMSGGAMPAMPAMSAEGIAAIYALDAEIARAEAARAATLARQGGDRAVLERLVGAEWAARVLSLPG
ncbi:MAG: TolC family protein, partial [Deltaproteobacteria bacterium]|nr:TolC family protein [Deltaproteobacteria bacterium]